MFKPKKNKIENGIFNFKKTFTKWFKLRFKINKLELFFIYFTFRLKQKFLASYACDA